MLGQRFPLPDLPRSWPTPLSTLSRCFEPMSVKARRGGGGPNLLARTLGILLDLEGPMQGRPEAEWEHFWGDKFKATL